MYEIGDRKYAIGIMKRYEILIMKCTILSRYENNIDN